jgi:hypothetical protein
VAIGGTDRPVALGAGADEAANDDARDRLGSATIVVATLAVVAAVAIVVVIAVVAIRVVVVVGAVGW